MYPPANPSASGQTVSLSFIFVKIINENHVILFFHARFDFVVGDFWLLGRLRSVKIFVSFILLPSGSISWKERFLMQLAFQGRFVAATKIFLPPGRYWWCNLPDDALLVTSHHLPARHFPCYGCCCLRWTFRPRLNILLFVWCFLDDACSLFAFQSSRLCTFHLI